MKIKMHPDMIEATRLTQEGRLTEATELLQKMLQPDATRDGRDVAVTTSGSATKGFAKSANVTDIDPVADEENRVRKAEEVPAPRSGLRGVLDKLIGKRTAQPGASRRATAAPSRGAAVPTEPQASQFLSKTLTSPAGTRAYKLFIPTTADSKPRALIVMLHGCSQSADDFAAGTQMNAIAEEQGFYVAYPEQSRSANGQKCWNWFNTADQQRGAGEPSLITDITRQICADYAIDGRRIYVAGLSAGGAAAAVLGSTYPDIYAAVGVHSGLACGAASDMVSAFTAMRSGQAGHAPLDPSHLPKSAIFHGRGRRVPTIVFHGDRDSTVHPRNGDNVIAQLLALSGGDLRAVVDHGRVTGGHAYTRTKHFDSAGREALEMWVVHGADHAWSGGHRAGSYTDQQGPDASREMVRFFFSHAHPTAKAS